MERIASFCVDHTKLQPGMYLSRQDGANGEILTWDIRMKQPNKGSYLSPAAAHTLEHLFATYARNSKYSSGVVYVGPMGCLTGFYLLTTGLTPAEALDLTRSAFAWMAEYEGEIPGASAVECGNYLMMDPIAAKAEAAAMLPVLEKLDGSYEEAARVMGAKPFTIFRRVIFPELLPAMLSGAGLAFGRCLGEYGSVVFIAGNKPYYTEITPLIIMSKLQEFDYESATSIALVTLAVSFLILFGVNLVQARNTKRIRGRDA